MRRKITNLTSSFLMLVLAFTMLVPALTLISCNNDPVTALSLSATVTEGTDLTTDSPKDWTVPSGGLQVVVTYSDNSTRTLSESEYSVDYTNLRAATNSGTYFIVVSSSLVDIDVKVNVTVKLSETLVVNADAVSLTTDDPKNWKMPEGLVVSLVSDYGTTVLTADQYTIDYTNLYAATDNGTYQITVTDSIYGHTEALTVTVEGWEPNGPITAISLDTSAVKTLVSTARVASWTPEGITVTATYQDGTTKEFSYSELSKLGATVSGLTEFYAAGVEKTTAVTADMTNY